MARKTYTTTDIDTVRSRYHCFMDEAAILARKSQLLQKHGCVIVYKNHIISSAVNTEQCGSCSSHAEINAINKIKHRRNIMSMCKMYVARIGTPSMGYCTKYSRPCNACTQKIISYGIGKVYYTTNYDYNMKMQSMLSNNHSADDPSNLLLCKESSS